MTAPDQDGSRRVRRRARCGRRGAVLVEVALIAPVAFLMLMGVIVGGVAVFRSQHLTALAREGSRWAATHAERFAQQNHRALPTATEVYNAAIRPLAGSLGEKGLTYDVVYDLDRQTVTVHLDYQWLPHCFGMNFQLSATSEGQLSN